jgi:hypothetical protein
MKNTITIFYLILASVSLACEESATAIAKRVIADQSSAFTPSPLEEVPRGVAHRTYSFDSPDDIASKIASNKAHEVMRDFMLSEAVSEQTRIAYAITLLSNKMIPKLNEMAITSLGIVRYSVDRSKVDQYRNDRLILEKRLMTLEKANYK